MFRILTVLICLLTAALAHAGVVRDGGCYSDCTFVDSKRLDCQISTCDGTQRPQSGVDSNGHFFKRSTYNDTCKYYNGASWIPCAKKRFDGATWVLTDPTWDMYWMEAMYMVLLHVTPSRPEYATDTFSLAATFPPIDTSTPVTCDSAVAKRVFTNFTSGSVNAYPVILQCLQAGTWTGNRTFFIQPENALVMIAILMTSTLPDYSLTVSLTDFSTGSFVISAMVGK